MHVLSSTKITFSSDEADDDVADAEAEDAAEGVVIDFALGVGDWHAVTAITSASDTTNKANAFIDSSRRFALPRIITAPDYMQESPGSKKSR